MPNSLRVGFMGTPDFAATALQAILQAGHTVVCVYSQPPRPKGRGQKIQKSPIHLLADVHDISVFTPQNFKNIDAVEMFKSHDLDIAIVAAYGLILPQVILDAPRFGCINIHASLLPRWRGASPIQHAIWKGDEKTGITTMQMDRGLDTGAIISIRDLNITPTTTSQSLHDDLARLGGEMIVENLVTLTADKKLQSAPQDNALSTYAPLLKKSDGKINWADSAQNIDCQIRALNPWPGTWTTKSNNIFKVVNAVLTSEVTDRPPGTLLNKHGDIACGDGSVIRVTGIKPPNKQKMDFASAINGKYMSINEQFS